jgi:hypothetical protein
MFELRHTSCCGVMEISGLSSHKTPKDAMLEVVDGPAGWWNTGWGKYGCAPGLVIFTGVIRHTDGSAVRPNPYYGPRFAAYIRRHKLGIVTVGGTAPNRKTHPTHIIRLWVWNPNPDAIKAWWKKHNEEDY